jgi:hypothetical protein
LLVVPTYVEGGDVPWCFALLGVVKLHGMLNAARGVSPFKRPAAPPSLQIHGAA